MNIVAVKERVRRALNFIFALFYTGNVRFLLYLSRKGGLGTVSSFVENSFLFECACNGAPQEGAVVEIGSFKGRTTISLAYGSYLKNREKVYAVDPQEKHEVKQLFLKNIRNSGVQAYISPIFKISEDAAGDFHGPIRLLFIDGCHEYGYVKKDILLWKGLLSEGGIIAMHDYGPQSFETFAKDVCRAVKECIIDDPDFIVEGCVDSVFFASWKVSRPENRKIFERYKKIEKKRAYLKLRLDKSVLKY
ncbi:MAG TPA: hypothetical protein DCL35_05355 [Candidatus Omnitrophica bacterium]|nr:hypothetical protein [Candidatus Omnitrophota bacterium]